MERFALRLSAIILRTRALAFLSDARSLGGVSSRTAGGPAQMPGLLRLEMVEAAGVEPASETTQRQRLRVCPTVDFPGQACGHA